MIKRRQIKRQGSKPQIPRNSKERDRLLESVLNPSGKTKQNKQPPLLQDN